MLSLLNVQDLGHRMFKEGVGTGTLCTYARSFAFGLLATVLALHDQPTVRSPTNQPSRR